MSALQFIEHELCALGWFVFALEPKQTKTKKENIYKIHKVGFTARHSSNFAFCRLAEVFAMTLAFVYI